MEFEYIKVIAGRYCEEIDDYEYHERVAHYEPSNSELLRALAEIVSDDYFESERLDMVVLFIKEYDLTDRLVEDYKDELHDYFESYAWGRK